MSIWNSSRRRAERERQRAGRDLVHQVENAWRLACEHVGLCRSVSVAAGATIVTPALVNADVSGSDPVLIVRLMPGQLPSDFRDSDIAGRLAAALGWDRIRIYPRGDHWIRIELLTGDPLDGDVVTPLLQRQNSVNDTPVLIARDELGTAVTMPWSEAPNTCVQGATRSGKSVWCYSVLAQLARLADVRIAGSDPSGLLLGRPWEGTVHREWQAVGSADVLAHRDMLVRLVEEMDRRIVELPERTDKITRFSPGLPLIVVVLEEFAGLLRLASTEPTPKGEAKIRDQLLGLYGRLVSEGHKAGMRLLVITQRADATVVGGFEREQLGLRISFRISKSEALRMLHDGDEGAELLGEHRRAAPGVCLMEWPAHELVRARGPRLPGPSEDADYARFWDEVRQGVTARLHPVAA